MIAITRYNRQLLIVTFLLLTINFTIIALICLIFVKAQGGENLCHEFTIRYSSDSDHEVS